MEQLILPAKKQLAPRPQSAWPLVLLTLLGVLLFASFLLTRDQGLWADINKSVFFFFNELLVRDRTFLYIVAYSNLRVFDLVSFGAMATLLLWHFVRFDATGKRKILCMGFLMVTSAVLINQVTHLFAADQPSPTKVFEQANRVSHLTGLPTKDASTRSFPGDHGMMLMVFTAFMARYFGWLVFCWAVGITALFSLPRIMSGAHWLTDVYAGSLGIVCMSVGWILLTPVSDLLLDKMEQALPERIFSGSKIV